MFLIRNNLINSVLIHKNFAKSCVKYDKWLGNKPKVCFNPKRDYIDCTFDTFVKSLDFEKFIDDIKHLHQIGEFKDKSDISLLRDEYFTGKTLQLLNTKFIDESNSGFTTNHCISGKFDRISLNWNNYTPNCSPKENFSYDTDYVIEKLLKDITNSKTEQTVSHFTRYLLCALEWDSPPFELLEQSTHKYPVFSDISFKVTAIPDFTIAYNKKIGINIELKKDSDDNIQAYRQSIAQTVGCAYYNNKQDGANQIIYNLTICETYFTFYEVFISSQYLKQLASKKYKLKANLPIIPLKEGLDFRDSNQRKEIIKVLAQIEANLLQKRSGSASH